MSLKTIKQSQTAYLARPEFPGLIEIQERKEVSERVSFVTEINFSLNAKSENLLSVGYRKFKGHLISFFSLQACPASG
jgi:hypothetical protein